jgi:3-phosphoshikimate 1-carboxyvinyltransferase
MQANDNRESRSQWSSLSGVRAIKLSPAKRPITGTLTIPGSKSFTNRAIIIAAAAAAEISNLQGILRSDDSYWCIEALQQLGVRIEDNGDSLAVQVNVNGRRQPSRYSSDQPAQRVGFSPA